MLTVSDTEYVVYFMWHTDCIPWINSGVKCRSFTPRFEDQYVCQTWNLCTCGLTCLTTDLKTPNETARQIILSQGTQSKTDNHKNMIINCCT